MEICVYSFVFYDPANAIVLNALANAPKKPAIAHTVLQSPATAVAACTVPVTDCTMNKVVKKRKWGLIP